MSVCVVTSDQKPLMSTSEYRARKLLKRGKAVIYKYNPFTIKLTRTVTAHTQPIEYCCDTGYQHVGVSIKSAAHEYFSGQFDMLPNEKEKHDDRRKYRRARRNRLRFRQLRFNNRRASKKAKKLSATLPASGTWGACKWNISSDGVLTIHAGTGTDTNGSSPWESYDSQITSIKIDGKVIAPEDCSDLFCNYSKVASIDLSCFDTSNVKSMAGMFYGCSNLTSLDVSNFDTSKVTNMGNMFSKCANICTLDLSNFDTRKVTNMESMFDDDCKIGDINISKFNTINVIHMNHMFANCSSLKQIDVSHFSTNRVIDMYNMFSGCASVELLDLSRWDTRNVRAMQWLWHDCNNLTKIVLGTLFANINNNNTYLPGNWYRYATLSGKRVAKTVAISGTALTNADYDPNTQSGTWIRLPETHS